MAFLKPVSKREAPNYYESKLVSPCLLRALVWERRLFPMSACSTCSHLFPRPTHSQLAYWSTFSSGARSIPKPMRHRLLNYRTLTKQLSRNRWTYRRCSEMSRVDDTRIKPISSLISTSFGPIVYFIMLKRSVISLRILVPMLTNRHTTSEPQLD
jgi:hypothetical protein